jgi:hypothetical protein
VLSQAIDRIRQRLGDLQHELSEWEELGRATAFDDSSRR